MMATSLSRVRWRLRQKLFLIFRLIGLNETISKEFIVQKQKSVNDTIREIQMQKSISIDMDIINISNVILCRNPGDLDKDRNVALAVAVMVLAIIDAEANKFSGGNDRLRKELSDALREVDASGNCQEYQIIRTYSERVAQWYKDGAEIDHNRLSVLYIAIRDDMPRIFREIIRSRRDFLGESIE